jgi:trehalose 6-phosphate synthase/phosphatase
MAGAAKELGEALIVNPNNKAEIVDAIVHALTMTEGDQIERNRIMQNRLARYSIGGWVGDFMARLEGVKLIQQQRAVRRLADEASEKLLADYRAARKRLILLDYDGTLVPFSDWPRKARPSGDVIPLIRELAGDERNDVVIVSGRDKETLEEWFGSLEIGLVAEHGVWVKEPSGEWLLTGSVKDDWKSQVRPLMELYVDRTPGSFIEEKGYSLSWHYRKADPGLGSLRARELRDDLSDLTANLALGVLEGSKVIEVKDATIDKGQAAARWLAAGGHDFVLAAGDDWTDEDMFSALPDSAYTIKVGRVASKARFSLDSYKGLRALLRKLKE